MEKKLSDFIYSVKSEQQLWLYEQAAHIAISPGVDLHLLMKSFTTPDMPSQLFQSVIKWCYSTESCSPPPPTAWGGLKSIGTTVPGKTKKSSILPPTLVNNECLDQILNKGQTGTDISLEYLSLQHLYFSLSTCEHHVSTCLVWTTTLTYIKNTNTP